MHRTGPTLLRLALKSGGVVACLSPVVGLAVFWWLPFKPAVTLYVLINGLAYALSKFIELERLTMELDEILKGRIPHTSK